VLLAGSSVVVVSSGPPVLESPDPSPCVALTLELDGLVDSVPSLTPPLDPNVVDAIGESPAHPQITAHTHATPLARVPMRIP
jgi:hypothetical protein